MSTLQMKIKNGKILDINGRYFEGASEDGLKAEGNGWVVTIVPMSKETPGKIVAHCERHYSDGPAICHREFKLQDGILGLSGGRVTERYAYFRKQKFQDFLDKFGITAVKREDPNQTFKGFTAWDGWGEAHYHVDTDGTATREDYRDYINVENGNYTGSANIAVSNATWAIVSTDDYYGNSRNHARIIYTQREVTSLDTELTMYFAKKELREKVNQRFGWRGDNLGEYFGSVADARVAISEVIGEEIPRTIVEQPGMLEVNQKELTFKGIPVVDSFYTLFYAKEAEGKSFESIEDVDVYGVRLYIKVIFFDDTNNLELTVNGVTVWEKSF